MRFDLRVDHSFNIRLEVGVNNDNDFDDTWRKTAFMFSGSFRKFCHHHENVAPLSGPADLLSLSQVSMAL